MDILKAEKEIATLPNALKDLSEELFKRHNGRREIEWLGTYACA